MFRYQLAFILLLFASPAFAAGVGGQLKATVDSYPYHLGEPAPDLTPYLSFELNQKYRLSRMWRTQWRLLALGNLAANGPPEKFYADLPEAFIEFKKSDFKFRAGSNTVNWGMVDVMSPMDTVNTTAMFHPLRTLKQGAPMVEMQMGPEAFNLDLIYIPWQRRPLLPAKNSRWLPRKVLLNTDPGKLRVALPNHVEYKYDSPETLDHALNHNYGAKLASHLGAVDLQITHYEGAAAAAKIRPRPEFVFDIPNNEWTTLSPIELSSVTYRVRTTGFGFAWAADKLIVRGETAYTHTLSKDDLLQPWSWASVLAAETNVDLGGSTLTLLAQYYYTQNPKPADNLPSSSYRLFDRTPLIGARWAYSDALTMVASVLYESITEGVFWMAGADYKMDDHTKFGVSWRDFSARKDGLIKTFERNDHATVELTYFF